MDIDIDFKPNFVPSTIFKTAIPASIVKNGELNKHPCGIYFQNIPVDSHTNIAAIPYEEAAACGFFKIDCLHLSPLDKFESKQQIRELLKKEPVWELLLYDEVVEQLFQLHRHADVLKILKPTSVQEVADVIAIIRPNKRHLIDLYKKNKVLHRPHLYRNSNDDKSSFKRSHAIAYAYTVVLQLHLIEQGKL